jgi:hypothetical protein
LQGEKERVREEGGVRGERETAAVVLILVQRVVASILAEDGRAVASGGHGAARQLLLLRKEDDEGVSWAGPRWASAGREEEQSWARNGPEDRELYFFPKAFFLLFSNSILLI